MNIQSKVTVVRGKFLVEASCGLDNVYDSFPTSDLAIMALPAMIETLKKRIAEKAKIEVVLKGLVT